MSGCLKNRFAIVAVLIGIVMTGVLCSSVLSGCASQDKPSQDKSSNASYQQVTAEEAKAIMDSHTGYVILDVRNQDEYVEGHIPGAILIPVTEIKEKAEGILTDKNQEILVYCRSGNRSKMAADTLVGLGYTKVVEFGGINNWPYAIEK